MFDRAKLHKQVGQSEPGENCYKRIPEGSHQLLLASFGTRKNCVASRDARA